MCIMAIDGDMIKQIKSEKKTSLIVAIDIIRQIIIIEYYRTI